MSESLSSVFCSPGHNLRLLPFWDEKRLKDRFSFNISGMCVLGELTLCPMAPADVREEAMRRAQLSTVRQITEVLCMKHQHPVRDEERPSPQESGPDSEVGFPDSEDVQISDAKREENFQKEDIIVFE